ncbi:hypothetical protein CTAYLR_000147 [Chrysophaeum taylorii]|uniref:Ubiquitin-like protease family profile domain-containing protein n=1 Tax=Chrysophaeum taylorii TaxID=2483200 RepID=A0AAD7UIG0_9STRA|nr:hypothetical protein CTAYLR_000147 [Chrysophaeum taylorii]
MAGGGKKIVPGKAMGFGTGGGVLADPRFGLGGPSFSGKSGPPRIPKKESSRSSLGARRNVPEQTFREEHKVVDTVVTRSHRNDLFDSLDKTKARKKVDEWNAKGSAADRWAAQEREEKKRAARTYESERRQPKYARVEEEPERQAARRAPAEKELEHPATRRVPLERKEPPVAARTRDKVLTHAQLNAENKKLDARAKLPKKQRAQQVEVPLRRSKRRAPNDGTGTEDKPLVIDSDEEAPSPPPPPPKKRRKRDDDDDDDEVVLHYPSPDATDAVAITRGDRSRLVPEEFLNDNLVDFYLKVTTTDPRHSLVLNEVVTADVVKRKVHVFSSHFYTKLHETKICSRNQRQQREAYDRVARWTRGVDVFAFDVLVVPIVEHLHWSLAVVCNPAKLLKTDVEDLTDDRAPCVIFMDSLKMHRAATVHFNLRTWLCLEARKKNKPLHLDDTTAFSKDHLPLATPAVPMQANGWDCGVFVLRYAIDLLYLLCSDPPLKVTHANVKAHFKDEGFVEWFRGDDIKELRGVIRRTIESLVDAAAATAESSATTSSNRDGAASNELSDLSRRPSRKPKPSKRGASPPPPESPPPPCDTAARVDEDEIKTQSSSTPPPPEAD